MHDFKQVKRDIENSLKYLNQGGVIFVHDCLPRSFFEQAIPRSQYIWTGDVWKFVYYLLKNYKDKIDYEVFTNKNYRGMLKIALKDKFNISPNNLNEINNFTYEKNFNEYFQVINNMNQ